MNAQEIHNMMQFMSNNGMMLNETAYGALMTEIINNVPSAEWRNLPLVERESEGSTYTELSMRDAENGYVSCREDILDYKFDSSADREYYFQELEDYNEE